MNLEGPELIVAILALVGPALVWLGLTVGRLSERTTTSHKRIDKLEERLSTEFEKLADRLDLSIRNGWRHCPLAQKGEPHD